MKIKFLRKRRTDTAAMLAEPRWTGAREVLLMSGPIVLGSISYTVMEFFDKLMIAQLGTDPLAAAGSAALWSYTLGTLFIGVLGCVSTFVAQSIGRGRPEHCASYAWQGIYLSLLAALVALALLPLSGPLFRAMNHSPEVTHLELVYFRVRLLGYPALAMVTALAAFFQAVNRPMLPAYTAIAANSCNLLLNYLLIFGKWGFPALGVAGAAIATVIAQFLQTAMLAAIFLGPAFHARYGTRLAYAFDRVKVRELLRVGLPNGASLFLDIANWAVFTSFLVGSFGAAALAAHNVALSFMHVSFMPALALNQGIAPIVGRWIGHKDYARAKARTYTAVKLAAGYMFVMGVVFAVFGGVLISLLFSDEPEVIRLGHQMLILAAIFQAFDAIAIVTIGALRGAGDTRWIMYVMFFFAYGVFLPAAYALAVPLEGGPFGAWLGATFYIILLGAIIFYRFYSERWRELNIFAEEVEKIAAPVPPAAEQRAD